MWKKGVCVCVCACVSRYPRCSFGQIYCPSRIIVMGLLSTRDCETRPNFTTMPAATAIMPASTACVPEVQKMKKRLNLHPCDADRCEILPSFTLHAFRRHWCTRKCQKMPSFTCKQVRDTLSGKVLEIRILLLVLYSGSAVGFIAHSGPMFPVPLTYPKGRHGSEVWPCLLFLDSGM